MDEQRNRFAWLATVSKAAAIVTVAAAAVAAAGCAAMIVIRSADAVRTGEWGSVAAYAVGLLACPLLAAWAVVVCGLVQVLLANESDVSVAAGRLSRIETLLADQGHSLARLINLASLSDKAKSLIYRDRELEAVSEVVHEDLMRQDYDTAAAMIDMMEQQFGYADQAARFREELEKTKKATLEEKVEHAVERVQKVVEAHDWPRAARAAEKIRDLFPDNPAAAELPAKVEEQRVRHKRDLLESYGEAVRKNDVNRGVDLLAELDHYLTPQEAAALEESARGVFKAKLHNLGVQFAIHVTDQRWAEAVATGEEIMRDFPNSRMCHEVREKMAQLRELMGTVAAEGPR
jgi:hypothetical protein